MHNIYHDIIEAKAKGDSLLAVLIDPEDVVLETLPELIQKIETTIATHIFVGGSTATKDQTKQVVLEIKKESVLPVLLFPGDFTQISPNADALLFLSLLSGRNSEYLIGQQVKAIPEIKKTTLEVIPTGYILIDGGVVTAVERVSKTQPIQQGNTEEVVHTALAGQLLGNQLIYLEAGSGAKYSVNSELIEAVANAIDIPLIVGGGIRSRAKMEEVFNSGATMVVIGTAFEENSSLLESFC